MKMSVIVPTYRRGKDLRRCLQGLSLQQRMPDEVLVIARPGDDETRDVLAEWTTWPELRMVEVFIAGQVAALNAGLSAATGDIIAITDDDAVPRPDWIRQIEAHFASDPRLGGLGGRDFVHVESGLLNSQCDVIGQVLWYGRVVGNHHLASDYQGPVDILKGANMSYRAAAINGMRFDEHLRGRGAQVCNDMAFSLNIKRKGWTLLYDTKVAIDHYPAPRIGQPLRNEANIETVTNISFNHYRALGAGLPAGSKRTLALLWQRLIASPGQPGLIRAIADRLKGNRDAIMLWKHANRARNEASQSIGKP